MNTRIKVCCISSVDEARIAVRHGAAALGLVSAMPSGPGVIDEALIAEIAASAPPAVATFLLTSLQDADAIVEQQKRCGTNTVQICDHLVTGSYAQMRRAMPGVKLVQVVHVTGGESIEEARRVATEVDAILLDSGNQKLAVKELGGTGRTHDWDMSRRIVESAAVPVFLAGGLRRDNIADAIRQVRPFGVDLCSSLRTDGALDEAKVAEFMRAVREA
ncbi:MAG: phosphoribosylanthranilate isomerase [Thermoanaerobaculia bacterium]|nr:phosphoribosylanthranilate isomerase [Thermoanaerobaculia bacterium]